jgi:starvation-inducible outer membrane lipoprotein
MNVFRRTLLTAGFVFAVAGCATIPRPQLSRSQIAIYEITEVDIRGVEKIES